MKPEVKILFKTEASHQVGFGHVRRLLRIARELQTRGCDIAFAVSEITMLTETITYPLIHVSDPSIFKDLSFEFDVIILDEPSLPNDMVNELSKFKLKIGFDEMGPARDFLDLHFCTTLLGLENFEQIRGSTQEYIGPKYFIFPEDDLIENVNRDSSKILISMGGTDPGKLCWKFLSELFSKFNEAYSYQWNSIIGPGYPQDYKQKLVRDYPQVQWIETPCSMNELYASSQAIICCGGITPYEALKQGCLPMMLPQMQEQLETASALHQSALGILFGTTESINWKLFCSILESAFEEKRMRAENNFKELIEQDPTSRVINIIYDHAKHRSL